ncbi:nuclear transport factor 2 family protein [Burkholderia sp. MR1-5-21]
MTNRRTALAGLLAGAGAALLATSRAESCTVPIDRARFQHYLELFAAGDPAYLQYYADDVVLAIGERAELRGPQAIEARFRKLREDFVETFELLFFCSDTSGVAVEMAGSYRCIRDVENSEIFGRSVRKGEVRRHRGVVLYTVANGRIQYIRGPKPQLLNDWRLEE